MSKKESEGIIKLYIDIFGRIDSDWKSLLSPIVVDIEEMTPAEVKHARLYNTIFWCIFGSLALSTVIFSFPNAWGMITGPILTLLLLMFFSALSHNVKIRKSKAGRRELLPVASFAECFTDEAFYHKVNNFITEAHDTNRPMSSVECHALLEHILKNSAFLISDVSMNRLSNLIIKDYGPTGVLSFTTPRAVSKAKVTKDDRERLKWYFSK